MLDQLEGNITPLQSKLIRIFTNGFFTVLAMCLLAAYHLYYVFVYVPARLDEQQLSNLSQHLGYTAFVCVLSFCIAMAYWSLLVAYAGGPGYVSQYFKAEPLADTFCCEEDGQQPDEKYSACKQRRVGQTFVLLYDPSGTGTWQEIDQGRCYRRGGGEEGQSLLQRNVQQSNQIVAHFTYECDDDVSDQEKLACSSGDDDASSESSAVSLYSFRYCDVCENVQVPRSEHCSACDRCILKKDHHCPWIGTCVGQSNQKSSWLFLLYCLLGLSTVAVTTVAEGDGVVVFQSGQMFTYFLILLVLAVFLVQSWLIQHNWTQTELHSLMKNDIFSQQSSEQTWAQVFSSNLGPFVLLLPIGKPDPLICLDYGANIPVKGLLLSD